MELKLLSPFIPVPVWYLRCQLEGFQSSNMELKLPAADRQNRLFPDSNHPIWNWNVCSRRPKYRTQWFQSSNMELKLNISHATGYSAKYSNHPIWNWNGGQRDDLRLLPVDSNHPIWNWNHVESSVDQEVSAIPIIQYGIETGTFVTRNGSGV